MHSNNKPTTKAKNRFYQWKIFATLWPAHTSFQAHFTASSGDFCEFEPVSFFLFLFCFYFAMSKWLFFMPLPFIPVCTLKFWPKSLVSGSKKGSTVGSLFLLFSSSNAYLHNKYRTYCIYAPLTTLNECCSSYVVGLLTSLASLCGWLIFMFTYVYT